MEVGGDNRIEHQVNIHLARTFGARYDHPFHSGRIAQNLITLFGTILLTEGAEQNLGRNDGEGSTRGLPFPETLVKQQENLGKQFLS
jgi:hypothetical protein